MSKVKCPHTGQQGARVRVLYLWLWTREVLGRILHSSSTGDAGTFTLITICNRFFPRIKKEAIVIFLSSRENI